MLAGTANRKTADPAANRRGRKGAGLILLWFFLGIIVMSLDGREHYGPSRGDNGRNG